MERQFVGPLNLALEINGSDLMVSLSCVKYVFGREGGRDDTIVRFGLGNEVQVHSMVVTKVLPGGNELLSVSNTNSYTMQNRASIENSSL